MKNYLYSIIGKIKSNKIELLLVISLLTISGLAHGFNMFHYPYYENDEGVYVSQAWAILQHGTLAPYTYWYDHAPAGWIFIAIWTMLTGGFFTFGMSVNSGRVFMLVLHVLSSLFVFYIAKKLTNRNLAGIIAVLFFSLSPLGIYFQRRVLLDNIMVFWVLLSAFLLLKNNLSLGRVFLSAVVFGIAVLTKENAIFFIPAFLYLLWANTHLHNKKIVIVKWFLISGLVTGLYFLYAYLKGELFPTGFLGDTSQHVSLIETLSLQYGRGRGYAFWDPQSDFFLNIIEWINRDPSLVLTGIAATIIGSLAAFKVKSLRFTSLCLIFFWIFLMRGKTVINFYIVPIIPILGLQVGIVLDTLIHRLSQEYRKTYITFSLVIIFAVIIALLLRTTSHYKNDETTPQVLAVEWIKKNLDEDTFIVIDDYGYVDLHDKRFKNDKVFANADWFWKLQSDPEIRDLKYQNDWKKVVYIALSYEMLRQTKQDNTQNFLDKAFDNSILVKDWKEGSSSYFDTKNFISTNGDWMSMYKLKPEIEILTDNSWTHYKNHFLHSYGQVIDPANNNTTSEGQSYAMLRAVWVNDNVTFDGIWKWTRDHLQYRTGDKLFSWLWKNDTKEGSLGDSGSATDADLDITLALLFAGKRWGNLAYINSAKAIISDIWEHEVVLVDGHYYLTSGNGASRNGSYLLNPSYWSPATYRIFAEVDPTHQWQKLSDDTYFALNKLADQSPTGLPPNWIVIDPNGDMVSAAKYVDSPEVDAYGFDAFRTVWRVALDANWFNNQNAHTYLKRLKPFFDKEWEAGNHIFSVYNISGAALVSYENISTKAAPLSLFLTEDRIKAEDLYSKKFKAEFHDEGYWGDPTNYYDQNWAWFGTALYFNASPNLWNK